MSLSNSLQSYADCLDFFEAVVDDPKGGRVFIGDHAKAHHFRMRCNQARQLHREQNKRIHDIGTKLYGASEYDPLALQLKMDTDGNWWVYAVRMSIDASQIDLLSEIDDTPLIEDRAPLQIEDHSNAEE
jgi:hypothetical protein